MSKNFLEFQFEVTQVIAEISGVKSKMERKKGISAQKMPPKSRTQLEIKCLKGYGTVKSLGTTVIVHQGNLTWSHLACYVCVLSYAPLYNYALLPCSALYEFKPRITLYKVTLLCIVFCCLFKRLHYQNI